MILKSLACWPLYKKVLLTLVICIFPAFISNRPSAESLPQNGFSGLFTPIPLLISNDKADPDLSRKIEPLVNSFIKKWEIAGLSMAVSKDNKLVFAHGYGYSNWEDSIPMEPYNEFRIASISKLITAAAVFKLIDEGRLSLNDYVFGKEGILNDSIFLHPKDPRVMQIRVKHLLEHSGGWTTYWGDQMFIPLEVAKQTGRVPPVPLRNLVEWALTKRLHFTPGTRSVYSNLGYSILGLVIEKTSGMPYPEYVQMHLLNPLGIASFHPGKNLEKDRQVREVKYYEQSDAVLIPSIYEPTVNVKKSNGGNDIETLGAAGNWIASAPDLLKFVSGIDGDPGSPDILKPSSVYQMTHPKKGFSPYGWKGIKGDNIWWRTGSFAGSCGMLKKTGDDLTWVVLVNSSTWKGPEFENEINHLMTKIRYRVKNWPAIDLFENNMVRHSMKTSLY